MSQKKDPSGLPTTHAQRADNLMLEEGADWTQILGTPLRAARTQSGHTAIRHEGDDSPAFLLPPDQAQAVFGASQDGEYAALAAILFGDLGGDTY